MKAIFFTEARTAEQMRDEMVAELRKRADAERAAQTGRGVTARDMAKRGAAATALADAAEFFAEMLIGHPAKAPANDAPVTAVASGGVSGAATKVG